MRHRVRAQLLQGGRLPCDDAGIGIATDGRRGTTVEATVFAPPAGPWVESVATFPLVALATAMILGPPALEILPGRTVYAEPLPWLKYAT